MFIYLTVMHYGLHKCGFLFKEDLFICLGIYILHIELRLGYVKWMVSTRV